MSAKDLIKLLTRTCMTALESAVGRCVQARHYEVTVDHFLLGLLDEQGSDLSTVLALHRADAGQVREVVERSLRPLRTGNEGKPVFAPLLLQLIEDAYLQVTAGTGDRRVRSGALLVRLLQDPSRYGDQATIARLGKLMRLDTSFAREPCMLEASTEAREAKLDAPKPEPPRLPRRTIFHRVEVGDTLLTVAQRYAVDWEDVARHNGLDLHARLEPGSRVQVRVLAEIAGEMQGAD